MLIFATDVYRRRVKSLYVAEENDLINSEGVLQVNIAQLLTNGVGADVAGSNSGKRGKSKVTVRNRRRSVG